MNVCTHQSSEFLLIGSEPFLVNDDGFLRQRVQTFFVRDKVLVTIPGFHAMQRDAYIDYLNSQRALNNEAPLSRQQVDELLIDGVALIILIDDDGSPYFGVRRDGYPENEDKAVEELQVLFPDVKVEIIE